MAPESGLVKVVVEKARAENGERETLVRNAVREGRRYSWRRASSASSARANTVFKKFGSGWPIKRPSSTKLCIAARAPELRRVVGLMIETGPKLFCRKSQGSGMIRLAWSVCG